MSRLTVRLPETLHDQLETLARSQGVSLNQYLVYALTRQATLDLQHLGEGGTSGRHSGRAAHGHHAETAPAEQPSGLHDLPEDMLPPPTDK